MRSSLPITALVMLATAIAGGCRESNRPEDQSEHAHSHEGDDALIWVEENIEHDRFILALGHHGKHLHATSFVEPAVSITRDGVAIADARVFNSLISADGTNVIREEVDTIYEVETEDEPAHYAQGKLHLPKGFRQLIIRFRIALPGVANELTQDITIDVDEH